MVANKAKPSKVVLALSTQNTKPLVSTSQPNKPEIILHYNSSKGGVDTVDQMVSEYLVQQPIRLWPVKLFYQLIDVIALNSYIIWMERNPEWEKGNRSRRQDFLENLAEALILPQIHRRSWKGLQKGIQDSIIIMGGRLPETAVPQPRSDRGHCYKCNTRGRQTCLKCKQVACPKHLKTVKICDYCNVKEH